MILGSDYNLDEIINLQRDFFNEHITREIEYRLVALDRIKEWILSNEAEIYDALKADLHKSREESYLTEIGIIVDEISYVKKNLRSWSKNKKVKTPLFLFGSKSYIHYEPYGIVLIISPWNYPFQLALSPMIGAICAGNTVILKPSEKSKNVSNILYRLVTECFDNEYVACINGGSGTTESIVDNGIYDYIFFTGGSYFAKKIMAAAAKSLTPVTLELGGKSPCIVDADANIPVTAQRIIWGKCLNAGQTCVAPDHLIVHKSVKKELIEAMKKALYTQYGADRSTNNDFPHIITVSQFERLASYLNDGDVIYGGDNDKSTLYFDFTLIDNIKKNSSITNDEIFGPILPIFTFNSIDDVIEDINLREKPLALYYFTESKESAQYMIQHSTSGGVGINDCIMHVANHNLPFGGVGNSGIGKYHGKYSFETFSNSKAVIRTSTLININLKYAPFKNKLKTIKRFL